MLILAQAPFAAAWDLAATLTEHLRSRFPWQRIEVRDLASSDHLPQSPPSSITIEKGLPGRTLFMLHFSDGQRITVTGDVRALDKVVMTARAFGKGHTIGKDDLYLKLMDVTRIPRNALREMEDAEGKELGRSVIANAVLTTDTVKSGPSVRKGRKVVLLVESPGFRITAKGETQENGRVGEYVRVMNQTTRKSVTGVLVDEGTVRVEF